MTRECLFLVMLLFANIAVPYYTGGGNFSSGRDFYDTLVSESATGDECNDERVSPCDPVDQVQGRSREVGKCVKEVPVSHYKSIIDEAVERRWAFPFVLSCFLEYRAFDCQGCKISMADSLFGQGTRIRDVFLLARLSDDDKLHIHPSGGVPTIPQFGHVREEQYLALIAPAKIGLTANQKGADFSFGGMYRFRPFAGRRVFGVLGFNIPIGAYSRSLDLIFQDGKLFEFGFSPNVTIRETTITQFFKDFVSVEDFFLRAVLEPKGIIFDPSQQKVGIGDVSLFGIAEFGPFYHEFDSGFCIGLDSAQLGLNVSFPTASKSTGTKLWEIEFGNGGGFMFSFFGSLNVRSKADFFNPTLNAGIEINTAFCSGKVGGIRIAKTIKQDTEKKVGANSDIITPVFKEYYADPFEEKDTTISLFADTLVKDATVKVGRRVFVGVGNYYFNAFKTNLRLGIFYNYSSKQGNEICIDDPSFDTESILCATKSSSHRISWDLLYKFKNFIEVGFGTQHIFAGKNVPEQHELFFSFSIAF